MSIRYWLADLISGGELTRARGECVLIVEGKTTRVTRSSILADNASMFEALNRIAALETEHANATVRKMARIARGEI